MVPKPKMCHYFKCARKGATHQTPQTSKITWYYKKKMIIPSKPNSKSWKTDLNDRELKITVMKKLNVIPKKEKLRKLVQYTKK